MKNDPKDKPKEDEGQENKPDKKQDGFEDNIIPDFTSDDLTILKEGIDSPLLPNID